MDDAADRLIGPPQWQWNSGRKVPGKLTWLSVRIQRPGRLPFNDLDAEHVTFLGLIRVLQRASACPGWPTKEVGQLPYFSPLSSHRSDRPIIVYRYDRFLVQGAHIRPCLVIDINIKLYQRLLQLR